eukprot:TRINITY_DN31501_c0_g1_i1.p1 TRINITY_DN31501_c0_g1~~TRINITY_DN31501_c0_g1_i1.p1  ORF type:complete len:164 (+),score=11.08 TRINITY_DN31501_c0_g1_i1:23-514(+)
MSVLVRGSLQTRNNKINKSDTSDCFMAIENKTALEELFQNHGPGLIRFLSRKMKSTEDAEDIAQNAFIRIQRVANSGELDNLKAYLYQTASNLAIDQLRREKLHNNYVNQETTKHLSQDESSSPSMADQCTPDRLLTAQRQLKEIRKALAYSCIFFAVARLWV